MLAPPSDDDDSPTLTSADTDTATTTAAAGGSRTVIKAELRQAVQQLQQHYLLFSARWAAELCCEMKDDEESAAVSQPPAAPTAPLTPTPTATLDLIALALSYMQLHEYNRAAWQLREVGALPLHSHQQTGDGTARSAVSAYAIFLRFYSTYLAWNQRRSESKLGQSSSAQQKQANAPTKHQSSNPADMELRQLLVECQEACLLTDKQYKQAVAEQQQRNDENQPDEQHTTTPDMSALHVASLYYLYALLCQQISSTTTAAAASNQQTSNTYITTARAACVRSVNLYPWNWSAWKLLASLCPSRDGVLQLCLPAADGTINPMTSLNDHWMRHFWLAEVLLELHDDGGSENQPSKRTDAEQSGDQPLSAIDLLETLSYTFPDSTHLLQSAALAHYHNRDFDSAHQLFDALRDIDPFRIESLDTYSNILYVKELRPQLSYLAHFVQRYHRYHSQSCIIIGNYYSLAGNHELAISYFQRAIKLDPNYLSAYTLMGHEFIELRNTGAAIDAYRHAVDINSRDYRAWYGLGQAYEILQLYHYALYYFRRACTLRPYDPRMWAALAESYTRIGDEESAIKAYIRAEGNEDREGLSVYRLAKLFAKRGDQHTAALYYKKVLIREQRSNATHRSAEEESDDLNATAALLKDTDTMLQQQQQQRADDHTADEQFLTLLPIRYAYSTESIESLLFLAEHAKQLQQYESAEQYCNRLLDVGSEVGQSAKALLQEVRALKQWKKQHT